MPSVNSPHRNTVSYNLAYLPLSRSATWNSSLSKAPLQTEPSMQGLQSTDWKDNVRLPQSSCSKVIYSQAHPHLFRAIWWCFRPFIFTTRGMFVTIYFMFKWPGNQSEKPSDTWQLKWFCSYLSPKYAIFYLMDSFILMADHGHLQTQKAQFLCIKSHFCLKLRHKSILKMITCLLAGYRISENIDLLYNLVEIWLLVFTRNNSLSSQIWIIYLFAA